jgi:Tol biopolymer transport system component
MVAAFVTIEAEPAQASFPGGNGRIVFSSLTSEDIVSVNADGTGRRTVLSYGGSPTYSPDGRRIAFSNGGPEQGNDIYVMNADGTRVRNLTLRGGDYPYRSTQPAWSPDGSKLLFVADDIFVVNVDGSGLRQLTTLDSHGISAPTWSPDGKTILFTRTRTNGDPYRTGVIWAMNPDGTRLRSLGVNGTDADWSADGTRFLVGSRRSGNLDIYVSNADGSAQRRLADRPQSQDYDPAWSPDGSRIVFTSQTSSRNSALWVMTANGGQQRRITTPKLIDFVPSWQPVP